MVLPERKEMQLSQKIPFNKIQQGSEKYPCLLNFRALNKAQSEQAISEVQKTTIKDLKAGKGQPAYEEAHRAFVNWRYSIDRLKGLPGTFIRIRSDRHVKALREWTVQLLKTGNNPLDYLRQFTSQLDRMIDQGGSKYSNPSYVFADSTMRDVFLKLVLQNKKQQGSSHAPSSYEKNVAIDPRIRQICKETEGFPESSWTDKDMLSMIEYAKAIKAGEMIFVDHDYVEDAAERIAEEVL